jgi:hypothetical protein
LVSCENDTQLDSIENQKSLNDFTILYNDILSVSDLNEQLIIANSLSSVEKYNLWQLKLDNFLNSNDLDGNQIRFVNKLKNIISMDLFENEDTREHFNLKLKNDLHLESKSLFGEELGSYLLKKFENANQTLDRLQIKSDAKSFNPEPIEHCDCTKDGDCVRITGISITGLSWEYGTCQFDTCVRNNLHIFGFEIWESDDNGECKY